MVAACRSQDYQLKSSSRPTRSAHLMVGRGARRISGRPAPGEESSQPRYPSAGRRNPLGYASSVERLTDKLGRPVRDLRISVTDRCNFRCVYCMPKEVFGRDYAFLAATSCSRSRRSSGVAARLRRASGSRRSGSPAASRSSAATSSARSRCSRAIDGARPDADDQRRPARRARPGARGRRAATGSRSASTRSTTRCSAR